MSRTTGVIRGKGVFAALVSLAALAAATAGGCKPAAVEPGPVEPTGPGITAVRGDRITRLVKSPTPQKAADKGRIRGHIAAVKGDLVSMNVGSAQGVKGGQVLVVYRGASFVCHVRIAEVDATTSAGVVYEKLREPAVGDRVTSILR